MALPPRCLAPSAIEATHICVGLSNRRDLAWDQSAVGVSHALATDARLTIELVDDEDRRR